MNLSSRNFFQTGLQIAGVILSITGFCNLIGIIGGFLISDSGIPLIAMLTSVAAPLVCLAAGIFLLAGSQNLIHSCYPDEEEKLDSERAVFNLAIKIIGVIFFVKALPDAVKIVSNLIYIKATNPVFSTDFQHEYIYTNLFSTLIYLLFGWYMVSSGKILERLAFRNEMEKL